MVICLCQIHLRGWVLDFLIGLSFDAEIHYNNQIPETKGTAFQHALPGEILTESLILRLASFRHIEGCHLPIKGIGWLSTTRLIEYMYIKAKKDIVGFKPYHVGNNAYEFKPCSKALLD